jgi:hypothetical protein
MLSAKKYAAVIALCLMTIGAAPAEAAKPACISASERGSNDAQIVDRFIAERVSRGYSEDRIQADLTSQLCLVRVDRSQRTSASPMLAAASNASAVSVTPPAIQWDSQAARFYAISRWKWVSNGFSGDISFWGSNSDHAIGGNDSFGTSFNTSLLLTGYSMTAFGDSPYASSKSISPAADASASGAGYVFLDHATCVPTVNACSFRLNVRSGQEVISFKKSGTCKTVYGFAKYTHSWNSTAVTGIDIGVYSIGVSTSTTSNYWSSSSQPGGTASVC